MYFNETSLSKAEFDEEVARLRAKK